MNVHVHLGLFLPGALGAEHADESEAQLALRMAENARRSLLSGVTTIRTTGDLHHADIALARAVDRGWLPGPRIISSGEIVTITGGHGAGAELRNDGADEIRKATRNEIRAGARWIKIAITGGIATPGGGVAEGLMAPDELAAAVDGGEASGNQGPGSFGIGGRDPRGDRVIPRVMGSDRCGPILALRWK
ncbi:MAG: amidohydrolase family protein [Roseiarcus sp.]